MCHLKDAGTARDRTDISSLFPNKEQEKELGVCMCEYEKEAKSI